ncbi:MAG: hypothetical protein BWY49_00662 [Candidatus Omnitrophica bacterium ADurb.Bin314]|nr:MAG: hypothetical protein BWY49_00662 [Candidatus Omnitrophica bacterium ADurb.Bin314]
MPCLVGNITAEEFPKALIQNRCGLALPPEISLVEKSVPDLTAFKNGLESFAVRTIRRSVFNPPTFCPSGRIHQKDLRAGKFAGLHQLAICLVLQFGVGGKKTEQLRFELVSGPFHENQVNAIVPGKILQNTPDILLGVIIGVSFLNMDQDR